MLIIFEKRIIIISIMISVITIVVVIEEIALTGPGAYNPPLSESFWKSHNHRPFWVDSWVDLSRKGKVPTKA